MANSPVLIECQVRGSMMIRSAISLSRMDCLRAQKPLQIDGAIGGRRKQPFGVLLQGVKGLAAQR